MMVQPHQAKRLSFDTPSICFGTSPLGDMPDTYGYSVSEEQASETLNRIFDEPVSFLDTSRNYGMGRSEERIGMVLRARHGLPKGCILATKIDRDMQTNRLDAAQARRSVEQSLQALGLDRLQILHLHDPEHCADLTEITSSGGAMDELFRMKEEGLVDAVGLAMGNLPLMTDLLKDWEFDALVSHNRYTLLNRAADDLFNTAHARGIAIFNAAPYASGILAKGSAQVQRITYQDATDEQLDPVRAIEAICARYGVTTGAVALQFSMRDPRITSTIVGVSKPSRVAQTFEWAEHPVPESLWEELAQVPFSREDPEANREYKAC